MTDSQVKRVLDHWRCSRVAGPLSATEQSTERAGQDPTATSTSAGRGGHLSRAPQNGGEPRGSRCSSPKARARARNFFRVASGGAVHALVRWVGLVERQRIIVAQSVSGQASASCWCQVGPMDATCPPATSSIPSKDDAVCGAVRSGPSNTHGGRPAAPCPSSREVTTTWASTGRGKPVSTFGSRAGKLWCIVTGTAALHRS